MKIFVIWFFTFSFTASASAAIAIAGPALGTLRIQNSHGEPSFLLNLHELGMDGPESSIDLGVAFRTVNPLWTSGLQRSNFDTIAYWRVESQLYGILGGPRDYSQNDPRVIQVLNEMRHTAQMKMTETSTWASNVFGPGVLASYQCLEHGERHSDGSVQCEGTAAETLGAFVYWVSNADFSSNSLKFVGPDQTLRNDTQYPVTIGKLNLRISDFINGSGQCRGIVGRAFEFADLFHAPVHAKYIRWDERLSAAIGLQWAVCNYTDSIFTNATKCRVFTTQGKQIEQSDFCRK